MMATDIDVERLRADPFWNKKLYKVNEVTDINKNGWIERADFEGVVARFR